MSRMASSSSRASLSGQNSAPCSTMASAEAGGAACGPRKVMVEPRARRRAIFASVRRAHLRVAALAARIARQRGGAQFDRDRAVLDAVRRPLARERFERDALGAGRTSRLCGEFPCALPHRLLELGGGHHFIDEPPVHGALAFDALLGGAEHVGAIAAPL